MREMSVEEAKALWDSVRAGGWRFRSYYKYSFTYESKINPQITRSLGGVAEDIYREEFNAEMDFSKHELNNVSWLHNAADDSFYSRPDAW